jgi:heterodisulfide reductase subunit A-like polyferredoxin
MQPSDARGPAAATDFLVISGGIIGLCLALNLKRHYRDYTVTLIEKEKSCGRHASGRNSGVPDSWKARFTLEGEPCPQGLLPGTRHPGQLYNSNHQV